MSNFAYKLGHIGPKWDIYEPKCTETDLKKSHICPILGQDDPIWMPNLTARIDTVFSGLVSPLFIRHHGR